VRQVLGLFMRDEIIDMLGGCVSSMIITIMYLTSTRILGRFRLRLVIRNGVAELVFIDLDVSSKVRNVLVMF
jgi:hypothetical protein